MLLKRFDLIDAGDLQALVEGRVPESRTLEFKRELTPDDAVSRGKGKDKDPKTELLRDLTALANGQGGDLLIGVTETNGVAADVPGVIIENLDKQRQTFENLIRTRTEPRLSSFELQFVPVQEGRYVIHFRVKPGLAAPHAVRTESHRNYFMRNGNGKHEMEVAELRELFIANEQLVPKLRKLHLDAVRAASGYNMPFRLADAPRCILTILPIASLRERHDFAIPEADALVPFRATATEFIPTLEGLLAHSPVREGDGRARGQGVVSTYALNHWSGRYDIGWTIDQWHVKDSIGWSMDPSPQPDRECIVHPGPFEQGIFGMARSGVAKLRLLGLEGPFAIFVTVEGLTGTRLVLPNHARTDPCWRDEATLGEIIIDEVSEAALMPLANSFWLLFAQRRPLGRPLGMD